MADGADILQNQFKRAVMSFGGGDGRLVLDFLNTVAGEEPSYSATDINDSTISHRVVFAAMKAMRNGSVEKLSD